MTIGEVHFRIAHIQSMMTAARTGRPAAAAGAGAATSTAAGTAPATATSASQFAAALQQASATVDTHNHAAGTHNHVADKHDHVAHNHDHAADAASRASQPTGWTAPAHGRVSSEFGPRWGTQHKGIDIAAGSGSTVTAAAAGVVRKASWYGGYGNAVIIDHGKGVSTLYGHNSELTVKPGDKVKAGQKIAEVGSTGDSTGPHLHFEVQVNGKKINPRPWLEKRGIDL